ADYRAWLSELKPDRAQIKMTTQMTQRQESMPAAALMTGLQGDIRLDTDGSIVSDVVFDLARSLPAKAVQRLSMKTIAKSKESNGVDIQTLTDIESIMKLRMS